MTTQPFEVCGCFLRHFRPRKDELPYDIEQVIHKYSDKGTMSIGDLHKFLTDIQGQVDATMEDAQAIFERAKHLNLLQNKGLPLMEYLHSDLNLPLSVVPHDMKAPLSHYYIYTGHNSYLTGNQFTSDSSVKPIIRALQKGVRVIELDLWPNLTKTGINVCHGRTLTSSVRLSRCLKAIKEHAFHKSEYPVVITFEDHLNKKLRDKVARMVKKTFQHMLFHPNTDFSQLPSPAELKKKIIISTKPPNESSESETVDDWRCTEDMLPAEIVNCLKSEAVSDDDYMDDENVQDEVPEYRHLIAIHAMKHKGDLENSLLVDPDKVRRLSLSEQELVEACEKYGQQLVRFTQRNLLRIYPKGTRLNSSNYNPFHGWKHGAQMVAFNMQGYESNLWWMQGMFRANNGCGYFKKPSFLCNENSDFNPNEIKQTLKVKVYMGEGWHLEFHHAHFDYCSPPDFYTKVGIVGYENDNTPESKTESIEDDWWPIWNQEFVFGLRVPELALLTLEVKDKDTTRRNEFGGQTCLPVSQLRTGIRCVPLYNRKGDRYKFVKLLIRFEFTTPTTL